jgi:hypothetical protein
MWSLAEYAQSARDLGASLGALVLRVLVTPRPPDHHGRDVRELEPPGRSGRQAAAPPPSSRRSSGSVPALKGTVTPPRYRSARSSVGRRQGRGRL